MTRPTYRRALAVLVRKRDEAAQDLVEIAQFYATEQTEANHERLTAAVAALNEVEATLTEITEA